MTLANVFSHSRVGRQKPLDSIHFDELTKALASSTSRRHALRTIVTVTVGGFFGLGGIRSVFGGPKPGPKPIKDCAPWCEKVFGKKTPAASQCIRDAGHHQGLCYQCPGATPASICCTRNTSDYCSSYADAHCCPSGQTCQNGQCVTPCTAAGAACTVNTCCSGLCCAGICCDSGETCLNNDTCCAPANVCGSTCLPAPCDANQCLTCEPGTGTCVSTCSSGQTCVNGNCCIANAGSCTNDVDCCSNNCDTTTMTCVSCIPTGDAGCGSTSDCCSGLVCDTTTSTCVACIENNDLGCASNSDCCSGICSGGTCVCSASASSCAADNNCCSGVCCNNVCCDGTCINGQCCPTAQVCGSTCGCPTGQTCITAIGQCCPTDNICGPVCLLQLCDPDQCQTCDPNSGTCVFTCESGQLCCGGVCAQCCVDSDCPSGQTCSNGTCVCTPNCTSAHNCGSDGCGGSCGTCPGGQTCFNDDHCVASGGGGGCFVAGTPIVMAGGYHKFIDSIQSGDTILAWNEDTKRTFPTPVVEALHHEETMQTLFDIELENRSKFTVNDNHPMYVVEDEGFVLSRELPARFGNGKPTTFLDNNNQPVKLVSLRMRTERCKVYNLHVKGQGEKGHTYFANGIVVHNKIVAPVRRPPG